MFEETPMFMQAEAVRRNRSACMTVVNFPWLDFERATLIDARHPKDLDDPS